jgi:hypothetical protein
MIKTSVLCALTALTVLSATSAWLSADVIINEFSAQSPERLLKWSDADQPSLGPGTPWFAPGFNDSGWQTGAAPLGFGYGDISTNLASTIQGKTPNFYLRKTFTASPAQAVSVDDLLLEIEYDDGFIAFINGVEVARCNMGAPQMFIYADQTAFNSGSNDGSPTTFNLGTASDHIVSGENVIAIQVGNFDAGSAIKFESRLRMNSTINLVTVSTNTFATANNASKTHTNTGGSISNTSSGSPVANGWLAKSPNVTSSPVWTSLQVTTLSDNGGGETGDGAISYTLTGTGPVQAATISMPPVNMASHWSAGSVSDTSLFETTLTFRYNADINMEFDLAIEPNDGRGAVSAGGFPLITGPDDSTVGYWRFDQAGASNGATVTSAIDLSGNGLSATATGSGGGTFSTNVPGTLIYDPVTNTSYPNSFSMDVSASQRRLQVASTPAFDTSFTYEMFIKLEGEPGSYETFARRQGPSTSRWQIDFDHAATNGYGKLRSRWDTPDGDNTNVVLSSPFTDGKVIWVDTDSGNGLISGYNDPTDWASDGNGVNDINIWHHIALTFDRDTQEIKYYYDYVLDQTTTLTDSDGSGYIFPTGPLEFGKFAGAYGLLIDEVRYSGRRLDSTEFLQTVASSPSDVWQTYTINLAAGDATQRTAILSYINANSQTGFTPVLKVRDQSYSAAGRALRLDSFEVTYAQGGAAAQFITNSATWNYIGGRIEPSGGVYELAFLSAAAVFTVPWAAPAFDDSSWTAGTGPLGYDSSNDYNLGTNLITPMRFNTSSLYMRKNFTVSAGQISGATSLQFTVDYDDGYIAFLNGVEIARSQMGASGSFVPYTADSTGAHNASMDGSANDPAIIETITIDKNLLVAGNNVFSAQVHNSSSSSSDLLLDATMSTAGDTPATLMTPAGTWRYFIGLTAEPAPPATGTPVAPVATFVDWIELHNNGAASVDLTNWTLTDDVGNLTKWTFPSGTSISAGGYLLLLADEQGNAGYATTRLHTNFKLSGNGEYLGLFDNFGVAQTQFNPEYPKQLDFYSYGRTPAGSAYGFLENPTPGAANTGTAYAGTVAKPDFDIPGGFHASAVTLTISTTTPAATIRYTSDGTEPTLTTGLTYLSPLSLGSIGGRNAHTIRARAFATGMVPSRTKSANYLVNQTANIRQAPALMITADEGRSLYKPHGILAIESGTYVNQQWQATDCDSYNMALQQQRPAERPIFLEYYFPDSTTGFREDAGIRYSASGYSRPRSVLANTDQSPWQNNATEKPSFNIFFRDEYEDAFVQLPMFGADYPVDTFEQLRPRAGKNDIFNPFIKDEVMRRMYIDLGQVGSRGVFNSLYVNGAWKGFYNTCERLREPFFQAHYPNSTQWDIQQAGNPNGGLAEGDNLAWNELNTRLQASNVNDESAWNFAMELVDPIAMADYFLVNIYGATWDWPGNNWVTARERSPEGRYRFYMWDAEGAFGHSGIKPVDYNTIQTDLLSMGDSTSRMFQRLERWPEFKLIMADRIHRHFFHDGTLDDSTPATSRIKEIIDVCVAEFQPLSQERNNQNVNMSFWNNWVASGNSRRSYLLGSNGSHFRDAGYWPVTAPVEFNQHGGDVPAAFNLGMTHSAPGGSLIYYTLDGTDPRDFGDTVNGSARTYSSAVTLNNAFVIAKARVRNINGEWCALTEAKFQVGTVPPASSDLVVAELLYNPIDSNATELAAGFTDKDDFEFIQLRNIASQAIDLSDVDFTIGISFDFGTSSIQALDPGAYVILVKKRSAFRLRYGNSYDTLIAGEYGGSLSNSGEQIILSGPAATVLRDFTYDDVVPWPNCADGFGVSLVLLNPYSNPDHAVASNWAASGQFGGLPGGLPRTVSFSTWSSYFFNAAQLADNLISGTDADPDGDGMSNLLEYILGSLPNKPDAVAHAPEATIVEDGGQSWLTVTMSVPESIGDAELTIEVSDDLNTWSSSNADVEELLPAIPNGNGTETRTFRDKIPYPDSERRFVRARVTIP